MNYQSWYTAKRPTYKALAERVAKDIENILISQKIDFHTIEFRAKKIDSFQKKTESGLDYDPKEMQDLAGIRVIGYVHSDVEKISNVIKKNFSIDKERSKDKASILGEDKVGYQSIHFVCTLSKTRQKLPENEQFKGLKFEIQVRTILQHAWAEIEHDRKYKFGGKLPKGIPRRFNLISGILELADLEFERVVTLVNEYSSSISGISKKEKLKIQINSTSLMQYMSERFGKLAGIGQEFGPNNSVLLDCINELEDMEILTLSDLDKIIPSKLDSFYKSHESRRNFAGIIRDILIVHDYKKYFEKAWKNHWYNEAAVFNYLAEMGLNWENLKQYLKRSY